jgi:GDP-L-fucose synthase
LGLGASVTVLDDMSRGSTTVDGALYDRVDVSNFEDCVHNFATAFAVFNLAARVAGVLHNQAHHLEMYWSNLGVLTVPVMAADYCDTPHFLQTSSVCIYPPEYNAPSIEDKGFAGDPHPANAGYAEAKRDGERAIQWSNLEHSVIVRPSNIIGEGDYFDNKAHVVPAIIRRALESPDGDFTLYGPGTVVREFIHSSDVASGMIYALARGENKGVYNVGTGSDTMYRTTMFSLARMILNILDQDGRRVLCDNTVGGGDQKRYSNASKLHALGWDHKINLREGVERTIDYYRNYVQV